MAGESGEGAGEARVYTQAELDKEIAGLRGNRDEILTEKRKIEDELRGFREAEQKRAAAEAEARRKAAHETGDTRGLERQLSEQYQAEIAKAASQTEKYRRAVERYVADARLTDAITAAGGDPLLLKPHLQSHVRMRETDTGDFEPVVVNDRGEPWIKDVAGTAMGITDLVEAYRNDPRYGRAFEGTGMSGSGAKPSGGAPAAGVRIIDAKDPRQMGTFSHDDVVKGKVRFTNTD